MNNEKREQQMMAAAEDYAESVGYKDENDLCATLNDFCAGWRAADNSRWIPVERELPKHDEEENGLIAYQTVLVCLYDGYRTEDYYDDIRGKWGDWDGEVEYWMPMPPAPRKEDKV